MELDSELAVQLKPWQSGLLLYVAVPGLSDHSLSVVAQVAASSMDVAQLQAYGGEKFHTMPTCQDF